MQHWLMKDWIMPKIKLGPFQKKRFKELNKGMIGKQKSVLLEPNNVVLVRKMSHTGKQNSE